MKIGIICDNNEISDSANEILTWIASDKRASLGLLISQDTACQFGETIKSILRKLRSGGLGAIFFKLNERLEYFTLNKKERQVLYGKHQADILFENKISVKPILSRTGCVYRFNDADVARIQQSELDLIIRDGSGILRGDILNSCRLGIISFHHANNLINRGGPPGFWEILHKLPGTGFTIQILTEEIDGGTVLHRGEFLTRFLWLKNYANIQEKANYYMKQILSSIIETGSLPAPLPNQPYSMPLFRRPNLRSIINYQTQCAAILIGACLRKALKRNVTWSVGFQYQYWDKLTMWKSSFIENPKGKFLADPFCIREAGRDYIFAEEYCFKKGKAHIAAYAVSRHSVKRLGTAIDEEYHLSYPYIFKFNGSYYMVPESSSQREIRLYKCTLFPMEWSLERVLISDVDAADSTIFYHNEKWWLFSNIDPCNKGDHCSELFAFYTDNPISGEWIPHSKNPLIIDPCNARMGGILYKRGKIFRVAQVQGFRMYGKSCRIKELITLTSNEFEERDFCDVLPHFIGCAIGTHHLHSQDDLTVFDYMSYGKPHG